jgi:hypothetical protein
MNNSKYFVGKLFLIGFMHAVVLYGYFYCSIFPAIDSDLIDYLPSLIAFCCNYYLIWHGLIFSSNIILKIVLTSLAASLAVFISFFCFGLVAFNTLGT